MYSWNYFWAAAVIFSISNNWRKMHRAVENAFLTTIEKCATLLSRLNKPHKKNQQYYMIKALDFKRIHHRRPLFESNQIIHDDDAGPLFST